MFFFRRLAVLFVAFAASTMPATAERPVVVELFTSQGCSSCPPADEMLQQLAEQEGVIALALHVDYWDYIGWTDEFADPRHSKRQQAYARIAGERMVFTPQVILDGRERLIGNRTDAVLERIGAHAETPSPVEITAERHAGAVRVRANGAEGPVDIHVVQYAPKRGVVILAGENAGRTFEYANVVTDWQVAGRWEGTAPLDTMIEVEGDGPMAILLQQPGPGRILAAATVD